MDFYIEGGRRSDAFTGTLKPIMGRINLTVRKFSYVTKLIIKDGTVHGVRYERHGKKFNAYALKEVILSAGTLQTPKILMLSGIYLFIYFMQVVPSKSGKLNHRYWCKTRFGKARCNYYILKNVMGL